MLFDSASSSFSHVYVDVLGYFFFFSQGFFSFQTLEFVSRFFRFKRNLWNGRQDRSDPKDHTGWSVWGFFVFFFKGSLKTNPGTEAELWSPSFGALSLCCTQHSKSNICASSSAMCERIAVEPVPKFSRSAAACWLICLVLEISAATNSEIVFFLFFFLI